MKHAHTLLNPHTRHVHSYTLYWPWGDLLLGMSVGQVFMGMGSNLRVGDIWRRLTQLQSSYQSEEMDKTTLDDSRVCFVSAILALVVTMAKNNVFCFVRQGRRHWSHWLYFIDLTGSDLTAGRREGMSRHICYSRTWASMKGKQHRDVKGGTPNCNKGSQQTLTLNNDKQAAPVLTASIGTTPEWKLIAGTWAVSSNQVLNTSDVSL